MTSEAREASLDQGQPIKLIRFTRAAKLWTYADADRVIVYNGDTYAKLAIGVSEIRDSSEANKASIQITLPKDADVAANWRPFPPSDPVFVTVLTQHYGETDFLVDWIGRIIGSNFNNTTLTLTSEPSGTAARRRGRTRVWQRSCDVPLFSQGRGMCNLIRDNFAVPAVLTAVSGLTLTAAAFGSLTDGRFQRGDIEWMRSDGLVERRSIDAHSGTSIVIDSAGAELAVGLAVTAYPGCGQTFADCEYFSNTDNYGGELYMPGRDYYDGHPID
ncbi:MAG TPA: phage BR0599 family protein [Mizugakiibacter sp.]